MLTAVVCSTSTRVGEPFRSIGIVRAPLLRATRSARDAKAEDLAEDHALPDVVPSGRDGVHIASNPSRLREVSGVGCG